MKIGAVYIYQYLNAIFEEIFPNLKQVCFWQSCSCKSSLKWNVLLCDCSIFEKNCRTCYPSPNIETSLLIIWTPKS